MSKLNLVTKPCGVFLSWAAAAVAVTAQKFATLLIFNGANADLPVGPLLDGTDGGFYGTAEVACSSRS
jgi:hypothetical protein